MALWYEISFILVWMVYSVAYPLLLISLVLPLLFYPKATLHKYYYLYNSIQYILFCQDKKKTKRKKTTKNENGVTEDGTDTTPTTSTTTDPSIYFPGYNNNSNNANIDNTNTIVTKKTILFVRHGESTWNYTFNKGNDRSTMTFLLYFIPNVVQTLWYEYYYYMTGQWTESLLYDSPLSHHGIQQAQTIQQLISNTNLQFVTPKEEKYLSILLKGSHNTTTTRTISTTTAADASTNDNDNNHNDTSHLDTTLYLVSNLRRAITTAGIAFYPQLTSTTNATASTASDLSKTGTHTSSSSLRRLRIVTALQEISSNPDALCISPPPPTAHNHSMVSSRSDPISIRRYIYGNHHGSGGGVMDTTYHTGNKSLSSTGQARIHEFCHLLFHNENNNMNTGKDNTTTTTTSNNTNNNYHPPNHSISSAQNYIVTGHSLWFLTFFQLLLPASCHHIAKKKKLQNGSIIGFTLLHTTTMTNDATKNYVMEDHYMIDPTSLVVVHGGF
jgi:hypothetical protein